jgi:hypothetical protein
MDNKGKPKSLAVSDKIISAQVEANIGTSVDQASRLRLSEPTLNPIVKNREEIERSFIQGRPFLQMAEVTEMFATGGTGIFSCCMVQVTT